MRWAIERHIAMSHARSVEMLAAIEAGDVSGGEFTRDAVAAALRLPPSRMRNQMTIARELADRLPATMALLTAGRITRVHALAPAKSTLTLTTEQITAVEEQALTLTRADEQTVAQSRHSRRTSCRVPTRRDDETHETTRPTPGG